MGYRLQYAVWKELLRIDCVRLDKVEAFNGLDEIFLRILHENGVDPKVDAIVKDGLLGPTKK